MVKTERSEILFAAKAALKVVVPRIVEVAVKAPVKASTAKNDGKEHSYAAVAAPVSPAIEVFVGDEIEDASMEVNLSSNVTKVSQAKKAKLSSELNAVDNSISSSPDLHHKIPARTRTIPEEDTENDLDVSREKSNLYGVNFIMWFEVGIEGKDTMDQEVEDWGWNS